MTHSIVWDGIAVSISHTPNWVNTEFHHIELRASERLPATETGYRSHFIHQDEIALFESVTAFVEQWLEAAAQSPEWIRFKEDSRQLSLFRSRDTASTGEVSSDKMVAQSSLV